MDVGFCRTEIIGAHAHLHISFLTHAPFDEDVGKAGWRTQSAAHNFIKQWMGSKNTDWLKEISAFKSTVAGEGIDSKVAAAPATGDQLDLGLFKVSLKDCRGGADGNTFEPAMKF